MHNDLFVGDVTIVFSMENNLVTIYLFSHNCYTTVGDMGILISLVNRLHWRSQSQFKAVTSLFLYCDEFCFSTKSFIADRRLRVIANVIRLHNAQRRTTIFVICIIIITLFIQSHKPISTNGRTILDDGIPREPIAITRATNITRAT